MKKNALFYSGILLLIAISTLGFSNFETSDSHNQEVKNNVKSEASELDSKEAFEKMMSVITHKRCLNCHPSGDQPRQGEDSHIHRFEVQRGDDNQGAAALQCNTCHQKENNDIAGVPGAPHWGLAPKSMAWEGLTKIEIARSMTNRKNNGGRSLKEIVKHLTEDPLVLWAFNPGVNHEGNPREKPPISKVEFIDAVKEWAENGAKIPEE